MGRIIRRMLERPKPRRTRIEHFEKIQKVLHKIYLNIPEEEGQGQIEILWGKATRNGACEMAKTAYGTLVVKTQLFAV